MATAGEIDTVRKNTNEPTEDDFTTVYITGLIDSYDVGGVNLASGVIWRQKAAVYAELVNVSEAGASRDMSDLFKHAQEMAAYYEGLGASEVDASINAGRARVHVIDRRN